MQVSIVSNVYAWWRREGVFYSLSCMAAVCQAVDPGIPAIPGIYGQGQVEHA